MTMRVEYPEPPAPYAEAVSIVSGTGERLPRGRHGLPREHVAEIQRARIMRALADTMAEKGFAATTVSDIIGAAGVSRATFYEHFTSKDDCLAKSFEAAAQILLSRTLDAAGEAAGPPMERFERGLRAYLDALASEPAFARLFLIEIYAAGPEALKTRAAMQKQIAAVGDRLFGAETDADRFASEALVAAISGLVTAKLVTGDLDGLRALHGPLLEAARRLHGT
jgi:AcrR family transcriptional regulator